MPPITEAAIANPSTVFVVESVVKGNVRLSYTAQASETQTLLLTIVKAFVLYANRPARISPPPSNGKENVVHPKFEYTPRTSPTVPMMIGMTPRRLTKVGNTKTKSKT